jgi:hypothetical protein
VGTVLFLPEIPELKISAGAPVGAESLEALGSRLQSGLRDVENRAKRGFDALVADRGAVRDALRAAAAKRIVEADPELKKQLAAAEAHFAAEQKRVVEAREQLTEAAKTLEAEFARLRDLLA